MSVKRTLGTLISWMAQSANSPLSHHEAGVLLAMLEEAPPQALPNDHPMKKAWDEWCDTDEFKNALRWAVETKYDDGRPVSDINREQHAKGAMWLAFTKGMMEAEYGTTPNAEPQRC